MAKTIEDLEKEYENKELDNSWFQQQSALGTEADRESAYDENGNHHCIDWYDCSLCPARVPECFL